MTLWFTFPMALTYKGQLLTGTISRQGMYAGGAQHFVLFGKMLCPSGLNYHANDLRIHTYKATVQGAERALPYVSCKKCSKRLAEIIEEHKKKASAE